MRRVDLLKKILLTALVLALILTGKVFAKESSWQPEIRVGILRGVSQVNLQMSAPSLIVDVAGEKILRRVAAGENFSIDAASLNVDAIEIRGEKIPLKDLEVTIDGRKYFGGVRLDKKNNLLTVINLAPVEEYLRGVVPEEMPVYFSPEALKAQAVAARTFTLKNRNRHAAEGFDLCATNHCQFYGGVDSARSLTDEIIKETRGEVIFYGGRIVDANFHTDSGGMTESVLEVWGSAAPHLQAVAELEKKTQAWTVEVPAKDFAERIDGLGALKKINLSKLEIGKSANDRSRSGRVKFVELVGAKTLKVSGQDLRLKFSLPSTLFDVRLENGVVKFEGYGRGHGVGMSQYGAEAFAKTGWSYEKILAHYYSGTNLKKLY